jgi:hypothetical protein
LIYVHRSLIRLALDSKCLPFHRLADYSSNPKPTLRSPKYIKLLTSFTSVAFTASSQRSINQLHKPTQILLKKTGEHWPLLFRHSALSLESASGLRNHQPLHHCLRTNASRKSSAHAVSHQLIYNFTTCGWSGVSTC